MKLIISIIATLCIVASTQAGYKDFKKQIESGQTGILAIGYYFPNQGLSCYVDKLADKEPGLYYCYLDNSTPMMIKLTTNYVPRITNYVPYNFGNFSNCPGGNCPR